MMKHIDWNEFQAVSVVSFHSGTSNSQLLTKIINNCKDVKSFKFSKDGLQDLNLEGSEFKLLFLKGQMARITNKYYSADLCFVDLNSNIPLDSIPQEYFHGTIVYFDNNHKESFDFAKSYVVESNVFLEESSVKLLVCDTAKESDLISRLEIQKLCIDNGFELVELCPEAEEEDEDDLEDDFKETLSYPRIYQALEANVWPHLEYVADCSQSKFQSNDKLVDNCELTEKKVEDFEKLLYQFQDFKTKASNMDGDARKEYAEKVAMMFFDSVSGDDDQEEKNE